MAKSARDVSSASDLHEKTIERSRRLIIFVGKLIAASVTQPARDKTLRWPRAAYRLLLVRYSKNDGSGMHQASATTSDGDGVVAERSVLAHCNVHGR